MKSEPNGQNICNYIQDMICNWKITLDRVPVFFLRDNVRNTKKAISLLKTSSVPCFIHTLQLVIKDSLFKDNRIKLLLAKIRKLFTISGILKKATEMLKKIQVNFVYAQTKQKVKDTSLNSTNFMLERVNKSE